MLHLAWGVAIGLPPRAAKRGTRPLWASQSTPEFPKTKLGFRLPFPLPVVSYSMNEQEMAEWMEARARTLIAENKLDLAARLRVAVKDHDLDRAEKLSRILGNLLTRPDNVVQ